MVYEKKPVSVGRNRCNCFLAIAAMKLFFDYSSGEKRMDLFEQ